MCASFNEQFVICKSLHVLDFCIQIVCTCVLMCAPIIELHCLLELCIVVQTLWNPTYISVLHVSRLMCGFGARWNVQRNVIRIVNCTIPWINRYVNTHRDVWALPAHVCFSVNCIRSQISYEYCGLCVSVMPDKYGSVLTHMFVGISIHAK